ncbi:hypothetical protein EJ08DRAFT_739633 [Tothia fuscella]|uniref:Uncharacterized protein n=1 Tax=Tothia fuscella TaxID=1048955 RepID=A0A9P4NDW1_9PEZI|nr:hypothetical protein EJ08DRAFT_739633 [Tothia fuscella]
MAESSRAEDARKRHKNWVHPYLGTSEQMQRKFGYTARMAGEVIGGLEGEIKEVTKERDLARKQASQTQEKLDIIAAKADKAVDKAEKLEAKLEAVDRKVEDHLYQPEFPNTAKVPRTRWEAIGEARDSEEPESDIIIR